MSVSGDAIASFERRGLPFRDVFDSAFSEVVSVPYLSLEQSRQLLGETVVGMPPPFVDLAHCLAGGLARDVIRAARTVANPGGTLAEVTNRVMHDEIARKLSAVVSAALPIPLEPAVTQTLRALKAIDCCGSRDGTSCVTDSDWLSPLDNLSPDVFQADRDDRHHLRSLLGLAAVLAVFDYYCRTLLETFIVDQDDELDRLMAAARHTGEGSLDQLARARQTFAVNPFIAWEEVTAFRKIRQLDIFSMPAIMVPDRALA